MMLRLDGCFLTSITFFLASEDTDTYEWAQCQKELTAYVCVPEKHSKLKKKGLL